MIRELDSQRKLLLSAAVPLSAAAWALHPEDVVEA
jgi:hypothetical protein